MIYLTLKTEENNPWSFIEKPKIGSLIEVYLSSKNATHFKCIYQEKLEVYMMNEELSWFFLTPDQISELVGTKQVVKVTEVDYDNEKIFCSLRQVEEDPWPIIHKSLKVGADFNGKVTGITSEYIQVKLPHNYLGIVPKESLQKAGHEYKDFQENVVIGQGIHVFVSKVFIARQRIRLDLQRNKE